MQLPQQTLPTTEDIVQFPGETPAGWEAPRGHVYRHGPNRPMLYHQNFSGIRDYQDWCDVHFPITLREVLRNEQIERMAQAMLERTPAPETAPTPIPIDTYALPIRQTYIGTIGPDGKIRME